MAQTAQISILQELFRRPMDVQKSDQVSLQWHDYNLTLVTNRAIEIFEDAFDVTSLYKSLNCTNTIIQNYSKKSPAAGLFGFMKNGMKNIDFAQMKLDPGLWGHDPNFVRRQTFVVDCKWSPSNFVHTENALAVLTNIGKIEIFVRERCKWTSVVDLSSYVRSYYIENSQEWSVNNIEDAIKCVDCLFTTCVCWSPQLVTNSQCLLVTAQRNGDLIFWKIVNKNNIEMYPEFMSKHNFEAGNEISSLLWVPKAENQFYLIRSTSRGEVFVHICRADTDNITILNTITVWAHIDKMPANYMSFENMYDKYIVIYSKHRHLIVQIFDVNINLISQSTILVNDYRISAIVKSIKGYYLTTNNCKIYKINIKIMENTVNVKQAFEIKETYPDFELYGLGFSKNHIYCAIILLDRRILDKLHKQKSDVVYFTLDNHRCHEINLLIENPKRTLTDMWDCIEMLRVKTLRLKELPPIDLNQLYLDANNDIYKLKIYYILVVLYTNLKMTLNYNSYEELPETNVKKVKDKIYLLHACSVITKLSEIYNNVGTLSFYELETFIGARKYIKYYYKLYEENINDCVVFDKFNLIKTETNYTCQCCDLNILDFTCKYKHVNVFCSISFTPIESNDYIVCKSCNATARIELYSEKPKCVLCDLYMQTSVFPI